MVQYTRRQELKLCLQPTLCRQMKSWLSREAYLEAFLQAFLQVSPKFQRFLMLHKFLALQVQQMQFKVQMVQQQVQYRMHRAQLKMRMVKL